MPPRSIRHKPTMPPNEVFDAVKHHPKHKVHHIMNPVPSIAIINQSSLISDAALAKIALAIGRQLASDVAPEYGETPVIEFIPKGQTPSPDSAPCYVIDDPDVQGALGYHDTDANGNPFIKIFCKPIYDNGGTDYTGANSVSVTLSHEILELTGDADANLWADGPDGNDYAYELCDAVESDAYDVSLDDGTKVSVSNFVHKNFFNAKLKKGSAVRFDQQGVLKGPFEMAAGGYQIRRTEPGSVGQVFGAVRGAVRIDAGVVLVFGENFPSWKRPYKMRKAAKRAGTKPRRMAPAPNLVPTADSSRRIESAAKPPPYDYNNPLPTPAKSPMPTKTFESASQGLPHKPAPGASPKVEPKVAQLPEWLKKIAVNQPKQAESLAAGSGSHKYAESGTTDWLDEGRPDFEPRKPVVAAPAKPVKELPEWLKKIVVTPFQMVGEEKK